MAIEQDFDVAFIAALALREKQIQQNYRPVIAVHKWFARRPGTLFRGLVLSEFGTEALDKAFYKSNSFPGRTVADPFMGGGTPLLEANRVGCDVIGFDINPMAVWVVREEIEHLDVAPYEAAARELVENIEAQVGAYYRTRCLGCGATNVPIKYFLWVKTQDCEKCGKTLDMFPGYLLAEDERHPKNVLVCSSCGELNEAARLDRPGSCRECGSVLAVDGPARRSRCNCPSCGSENVYPNPKAGPPQHRMFAIEYYCPHCKPRHTGRFFKKPDREDLAKHEAAETRWRRLRPRFVPAEKILPGDETDRLHRWGYGRYRDLFNPRQLLGLELSCRLIDATADARVRRALATNLSDLLRYQNMLCRYDVMALKSLDIFSIHGFPVGLVQCESNLLGIPKGNAMSVGSGGWSNIIEKYIKAKRYCDEPFEIAHERSRKIRVPIPGEWIGERRDSDPRNAHRRISLQCQSATTANLRSGSLDAVFTDPPYFGNVQYGELMDFCYVWLRRLMRRHGEDLRWKSTRDAEELTGNITMKRGLEHFAQGLSTVFRRMARALKPGAPLAFTYHHRTLDAYHAVGVAIRDAGLVCSASLPCPAEMGGSIHIHGTASSIVDTVFVCRAHGEIPRRWLFNDAEELAALMGDDLAQLRAGGLKPSPGDVRCIIWGHLTRMTIWRLRKGWRARRSVAAKLKAFGEAMVQVCDVEEALKLLESLPTKVVRRGDLFDAGEDLRKRFRDAVSF